MSTNKNISCNLWSTLFKKVTQLDFDRIYFSHPWFLLDITKKLFLFAFRLMPNLLGLFHWCACRVNNLGAIPKNKNRSNCMENACYAKVCDLLFVAEFTRGYPLPIHRTKFGQFRCNEWALSTRAYNSKLGITCISHTDLFSLQVFHLDFTPNVLTLHAH